jgi:hypothetical protein
MKLLKYLNMPCRRVDRVALPGQLTEQGQRDDTLAATRTAGHEDDLLAVVLTRLLHRVQHEFVRDALLFQQGEVLPLLQLFRGVGEQETARAYRAGEEPVGCTSSWLRCEMGLEELVELSPPLFREDTAVLGRRQLVQVVDVPIQSVVQVRRASHRLRLPVERAEEVHQVVAVPGDLQTWVQPRPRNVLHADQPVRTVERRRGAPLLELDDDVRVLAGPRVHTGEHRVDAHACQRELVLHQDFDLA